MYSSSNIKGVLDSFASHLRIRRNEGDVTEIAQKYLALGCNVVPAKLVYESISSDYQWLEMKTHNPPLAVYADQKHAPLDVETFVGILSQGYSSDTVKGRFPVYSDFVDSVVLPHFLGSEYESMERWVEACRKDKWKDAALFLGLNYREHPKFRLLLETITKNDTNVDVPDLHKSMLDYKPRDKILLAQDMGKIIKSIKLSQDFIESLEDLENAGSLALDSLEIIPVKVDPVEKKYALEFTASTVMRGEEIDSLRTPVMETYRKRAGLAAVVDTKKIAQQMVAAAFIQDGSAWDVPATVLTVRQSRIEPLKSEQEYALVFEILKREDVISTKSLQAALRASEKAKQIASVCNQKTWDPRTLISYMIEPEKHMNERVFAKWSKMEKSLEQDKSTFLHILFSQ